MLCVICLIDPVVAVAGPAFIVFFTAFYVNDYKYILLLQIVPDYQFTDYTIKYFT